VETGASPMVHLGRRDGWPFPDTLGHEAFLMVQAMEAWFFADRSALGNYYGQHFRLNALPGDERNIEVIRKDDLEPCLKDATRDTGKGAYHKTRHGFDILALIAPDKVRQGSPHAAAFNEFLGLL